MTPSPLTSAGPPLYSARAIRLFSVVFTTVFGGVLLYQNLKDVGNKAAAWRVLLFSIAYTALALAIVWQVPIERTSPLTIGINLVGGWILANYFAPKHIPHQEGYPIKKVWKPLLISVLITLPFLAALLLNPS